MSTFLIIFSMKRLIRNEYSNLALMNVRMQENALSVHYSIIVRIMFRSLTNNIPTVLVLLALLVVDMVAVAYLKDCMRS